MTNKAEQELPIDESRYLFLKDCEKKGANLSPTDYERIRAYEAANNPVQPISGEIEQQLVEIICQHPCEGNFTERVEARKSLVADLTSLFTAQVQQAVATEVVKTIMVWEKCCDEILADEKVKREQAVEAARKEERERIIQEIESHEVQGITIIRVAFPETDWWKSLKEGK